MTFSWYPGGCTTTFTHAKEPLILPTKTGAQRKFPELARDVTPPCMLNSFLFNGHLQTAWTAMKYDGPAIHYKRRVFEAEDLAFAGHFTVDFVVSSPKPSSMGTDKGGVAAEGEGLREDPTGIGHNSLPPRTTYFSDKEFGALASDDTKPLLITLHGLSGGSYETYLRHVLEPLVEETKEGGKAGVSGGEWEALVINSRGCAGSKITTSILYNARATWDVRQVVRWCRRTWPNRLLLGIGYSLGASMLTNYLGEEGANCQLKAACIVSNPWKLEVSSLSLQRTYLGLEVYRAMGKSMRALFETHAKQITKNKALDANQIRSIRYLHEFDREVQCATWGYPTEGAYYRDASSADAVFAIRVPTFCIHAEDDPIACDEAVAYEEIKQNPYLVMCATSGGGHLSWFEFGGGRWHAKPAVNFLNTMAREVDFGRLAEEKPSMLAKGPEGGHEAPFVFEPLRRKLHVPEHGERPGAAI